MSFLLLLLGGIFFGLMVSMNGQLAAYLNLFEISFIVHIIGAVLLLSYIKLIKKEKIKLIGAHGYVYFVGFLGVALVVTSSLSAEYIGAAVTMALSVTGQLIISAIIDHFGWFHVPAIKFHLKRIPAYGIILAGLLIMIYA
jgi:transporter family-2 protein